MEKSLHFLDWLVWNFYWYYINELVDKYSSWLVLRSTDYLFNLKMNIALGPQKEQSLAFIDS